MAATQKKSCQIQYYWFTKLPKFQLNSHRKIWKGNKEISVLMYNIMCHCPSTSAGPVAQRITRLTTDQKIPGSNPGRLEVFFFSIPLSKCNCDVVFFFRFFFVFCSDSHYFQLLLFGILFWTNQFNLVATCIAYQNSFHWRMLAIRAGRFNKLSDLQTMDSLSLAGICLVHGGSSTSMVWWHSASGVYLPRVTVWLCCLKQIFPEWPCCAVGSRSSPSDRMTVLFEADLPRVTTWLSCWKQIFPEWLYEWAVWSRSSPSDRMNELFEADLPRVTTWLSCWKQIFPEWPYFSL